MLILRLYSMWIACIVIVAVRSEGSIAITVFQKYVQTGEELRFKSKSELMSGHFNEFSFK